LTPPRAATTSASTAAEVGMEHDARRVHHAREARRGRGLEPCPGARQQDLVGRHRVAALERVTDVAQDQPHHVDDPLAPPAREQRGGAGRTQEALDRRDGALRSGRDGHPRIVPQLHRPPQPDEVAALASVAEDCFAWRRCGPWSAT
jgi:hypothetical protein